MSFRHSKTWLAAAAAGSVVVGTAIAGGGAVGTAGAASTPTLKIALAIPVTGTGAIPHIYEDPVKMAVAALKKQGVKVTEKVYDTGLTAQKAITAVEDALQSNPSVIIGVPVVPQILAISKLLTQAQVPLLNLSAGNQADYLATSTATEKADYGTGASVWSFRVGIDNSLEAKAGAEYLVNKLHANKVGMMYQTATPPSSEINTLKAVLKASGGTLVATQGYTYAATNLTEQVLAMKTADGIMDWGYPDNISLALSEQFQNGIKVPTMSDQSGITGYLDGLFTTKSQLTTFYSAATCTPEGTSNSKLLAWTKAFKAEFGSTPTFNSVEAYDAVMIAKDAVTPGGGSKAVLKRLETDSFPGLCETTYKSNTQHSMGDTGVVIGFKTGAPKTIFSYTTKS